MAHDDELPRRALIISAAMGDGHNAMADALTEAIDEVWPGCAVDRVDTMQLRGPRFARIAQWAYGAQLALVPWTYTLGYAWLARSARRAASARLSAGKFFGPRLGLELEARRPDVVISTYPFGSAAMDWLRRERDEWVASATFIPAFHVHPTWAYAGIDLHFVMHEGAAEQALLPGFEHSMRRAAAPVRRGVGEHTRSEARRRLGLADDEFVVLMSGGAWGIGNIAGGAGGLVKLQPGVHVVAVCGRNADLERKMRALAESSAGRLTALGFVPNMPELMAAADVVVTNGAGQTVLEALCTPRPVVAFAPIAGHGTACTRELVKRNLAVEAKAVPALVDQVRHLQADSARRRRLEEAAASWAGERQVRESLDELAELWRKRRGGGLAEGRSTPVVASPT
ncbi:MAG TPA: glycosyltransferase [Acidimicrobiales bacterium]|nr:glycosyltransferase [Acidimicrobiales bacterium]